MPNPQLVHTITAEDILRSPVIEHSGRKFWLRESFGPVLFRDIGKRVYVVGDILQVENDDQLLARLPKFQTTWTATSTPSRQSERS